MPPLLINLTFRPFGGGFCSEAPEGNPHSPVECILTQHRKAMSANSLCAVSFNLNHFTDCIFVVVVVLCCSLSNIIFYMNAGAHSGTDRERSV